MSHTAERREVLETVRWLVRHQLYTGTSGNVSCRTADGFLITPTGVCCEDLRTGDLVEVSLGGRARGRLLPSSEWRLHRDLYRRRLDVGAVVHTHSPFATGLSCLRRAIPAFHYMVAKTGGPELRCARYATYGTAALSNSTLTALGAERRACLLANHGAIALGPELRAARLLAQEVEQLAMQYFVAQSAGRPVTLRAREMAAVAAKFATYGQKGEHRASTRAPRARPPR